MSPEQLLSPNLEQPDVQAGTIFQNEDELKFREASTVLSYTELKKREARADIDAAILAVPSGALEVEKIRLTPQEEISRYSIATIALRGGRKYDFDLTVEDELDPTMFNPTPKSVETQDNFDLAT